MSKTQSGSPEEHFEEKNVSLFWKKMYVFLDRFWTSGKTVSKFWQTKLSKCVKTAFGVSRGRVSAKFFLRESFFSVTCVKKIGTFVKKIKAVTTKLHSGCPGESFEENFF